jgi:hypothetical protein
MVNVLKGLIKQLYRGFKETTIFGNCGILQNFSANFIPLLGRAKEKRKNHS